MLRCCCLLTGLGRSVCTNKPPGEVFLKFFVEFEMFFYFLHVMDSVVQSGTHNRHCLLGVLVSLGPGGNSVCRVELNHGFAGRRGSLPVRTVVMDCAEAAEIRSSRNQKNSIQSLAMLDGAYRGRVEREWVYQSIST